ncbi:putative ribonuclease H-like domain-containing protein [Tanacetum coccineum]
MDVKSAFTYGKIEEEVYVCQPSGFKDPDFPDRVYKVEKSLYGLHQAPRAWYETLSTYLLDNEFQRGKINKTLFIKRYKGDILLVQVYVDDIILFGSQRRSLHHKKEWQSSIDKDKYVGEILKKFEFTEVKTVSTPMETQKPLLEDEDGEEVDVHMYRSMIGSLMYHNTQEPDIMFAIQCACLDTKVNPKGFSELPSLAHCGNVIYAAIKSTPRTTRIFIPPIEPNLAEHARISAIKLDDYQLDPVTQPPSPSSPFTMAAYQGQLHTILEDMDRYPNSCLEELEAFMTLWDVKPRVKESSLETLSMDELITQLRQMCEDAEDCAIAEALAAAVVTYATSTQEENNLGSNSSQNKACNYKEFRAVMHENFHEGDRVKFASSTLLNDALTWWNVYVRSVTLDTAHATTWSDFKAMFIRKYCPRNEIKQIENEL